MASEPIVNIKIKIDDTATGDLAKAGKAVSEINKQAASSLSTVSAASTKANAATGELAGGFNKQYQALSKSRGYLSFYSQSLANVIPVQNAAGRASMMMGASLLGAFAGGGLPAAIGAVTALVSLIADKMKRVKTEAEKLSDLRIEDFKSNIEGAAKAVYDLEKATLAARGGDIHLKHLMDQMGKMSGTYGELLLKNKEWKNLSDEQIYFQEMNRFIPSGDGVAFVEARKGYKEAREAVEAYTGAKKELKAVNTEVEATEKIAAEHRKIFEDGIAKTIKLEEEKAAARKAAADLFVSDEEKIRRAAQATFELVRGNAELEKNVMLDAMNQIQAVRQKNADAILNIELASLRKVEQIANQKTEAKKRESEEWEAILEKDRANTERIQSANEAALSSMSSFMSSTLKDMATGQMTYEKLVSSTWNLIADAIAEAFTKILINGIANALTQKGVELSKTLGLIQMNAALAGSASAASAAWGGPVAAVAAGMATQQSVSGVFGAMAMAGMVAEKGGVVPGHLRSQIAMLHPNETVLPADIAVPMRKQLKNGGGSAITLNISAVDADSVRKLVSSRDFVRALQSAQRLGRL